MHEQLERRLGALERVPAMLQLLHLLGDAPHQGLIVTEVDAEVCGLGANGGASRLVADHGATPVAHHSRVDVLVGVCDFGHGVDVLAALVRERRGADVGR